MLCNGGHRELHVLTHCFPTRRSSDLVPNRAYQGDGTSAVTGLTHTAQDALDHALGQVVGADPDTVSEVGGLRSEEHTSELQSLMRISYAVSCLKKKSTS